MENEEEVIVDNNEEEVVTTEKVETTKDGETADKKVVKPKRTPQEEYDYYSGRAKRLAKDLGIEAKSEEKVTSKTGELDETQLDYLDLKGINEDEDIKIIEDIVKKTGMTVRQALKDEYVISKLASNKTSRDVKSATPSSTKRGGAGKDDLASALAKYESTGKLPEDFELRSKVINAVDAKSDLSIPPWRR